IACKTHAPLIAFIARELDHAFADRRKSAHVSLLTSNGANAYTNFRSCKLVCRHFVSTVMSALSTCHIHCVSIRRPHRPQNQDSFSEARCITGYSGVPLTSCSEPRLRI